MAPIDSCQNGALLPRKFHIFGNGISFSISPTIHNAGFRHHGLPYTYDIQESASVDDVADLIQADGFGGASVTMPHKLHVRKYCDRETETARLIGAINTLVVEYKNGARLIVGENTDWSGLFCIIESYVKGTRSSLPKFGLVIGAGGASRAALYALHHAGVQSIYLVNRTLKTAERVREEFRGAFEIIVSPSLNELPDFLDIIINTVPAGATSEGLFSNLFKAPQGLCIDMSYKPLQTPLLSAAQRQSTWETVTGVQVLLAQAFDQYRLWTGKEPPKKVIREAVMARGAGVGPIASAILDSDGEPDR
jgi:pentafunctional AROM polypeptide